ncbi:MAG: DUF4249 domain-containing protein [Bacteroidales bacterium]|nr:DUF4249 domain-containing protein [Bacteroidales bacterium]
MNNWYKILIVILLSVFASCTEDIVIDLEEGQPLLGVEASFTDELKRHEAVLSYSADFYNKDEIRMVSGATVFVTDGVDTVYYHEDAEQNGHYFTDLVAGRKNTLYTLHIAVSDVTESDGFQHYKAESFLPDNIETVDSLVIKPFDMPMLDTMLCLYPYFQSLDDKSVVYMVDLYRNDTLLTDTLSEKLIVPMAGYAGYYVNGPEFLQTNMLIPIAYFRKADMIVGDRYRACLSSIGMDYMSYIYAIRFSNGSNPMMGAPSNVPTNIQPEGKAVGWFLTASTVSSEVVYLPD